MNAMSIVRSMAFEWLLCWAGVATAQIAVPALTARVTDQTATLSAQETSTLEQKLQAFEARKGSQIAILIVPTTGPEAIEQYALRVAEKWKLGRRKVDDGAILVVAKTDRALRIEVGYGLEGALNDATSKRIISEIITPRFQQGDFYGGIDAGVAQMIRVVDGEPLPPPIAGPVGVATGSQQFLPLLLLFALVVGGILRSVLGRVPGALVTGGAVAGVAWLLAGAISIALMAGAIALVFMLFGGGLVGPGMGHHHGRYRGMGTGGFGGHGGFGGGGGGFGGGGASGRW